MRTLFVIFGAVLMLFPGSWILYQQEAIKDLAGQNLPELGRWLNDLKNGQNEFSVSSSASAEPRSLID